jgi:hypothetical protein
MEMKKLAGAVRCVRSVRSAHKLVRAVQMRAHEAKDHEELRGTGCLTGRAVVFAGFKEAIRGK